MVLLVTDGHLPFPYGHDVTGYEVNVYLFYSIPILAVVVIHEPASETICPPKKSR